MKTICELKNISLGMPGVTKPILDDVSYRIFEGDFVVLLGSNGSGKSSLLKIIDGRYRPTRGKCNINPNEVTTVTQYTNESLFESLTVAENFELITQGSNPEDYLKIFNPNLVEKLDTQTYRLSGGEKQALVLGLATYQPKSLLLLDEHTAALDPKTAKHLMALTAKIIQEKKITCVMTTHQLSDALFYGNKILSLQDGRVFEEIDSVEKAAMDEAALLAACY